MLYFGNWIGHHFFSLCNWGTNVEQCNCGTVKPSTELRVKNGRGISRKIGLAIKYLLQCAQSSFNLHSYCQISLSMCSTVHIVYSYCRIFIFVCTHLHIFFVHTCTLAHLFVYTMRICTLAQLQTESPSIFCKDGSVTGTYESAFLFQHQRPSWQKMDFKKLNISNCPPPLVISTPSLSR